MKNRKDLKIGVLALQGAFIEHIHMLQALGVETREVRLPEDLEGLDGLIIPGGESTAIGKLMTNWGLIEPVKQMAQAGKAIWGTCAGMILLAKDIGGLQQPLIGLMDIKVKRNAFGSQLDSFESNLEIPAIGQEPFKGVFIRAPYIEKVAENVEVLSRLTEDYAVIVAARQDNLLVTAFHPELTKDQRFHQLFLTIAADSK
jgi:5'-phosphate synthase pdxT subunit